MHMLLIPNQAILMHHLDILHACIVMEPLKHLARLIMNQGGYMGGGGGGVSALIPLYQIS